MTSAQRRRAALIATAAHYRLDLHQVRSDPHATALLRGTWHYRVLVVRFTGADAIEACRARIGAALIRLARRTQP